MTTAPESPSPLPTANKAALDFLNRILEVAALAKSPEWLLTNGCASDPLFTFLRDRDGDLRLMALADQLLDAVHRRALVDPEFTCLWPYWRDPIDDLGLFDEDPDPTIEGRLNPWHEALGERFLRGRSHLLTIVDRMRDLVLAGVNVTFNSTTPMLTQAPTHTRNWDPTLRLEVLAALHDASELGTTWQEVANTIKRDPGEVRRVGAKLVKDRLAAGTGRKPKFLTPKGTAHLRAAGYPPLQA